MFARRLLPTIALLTTALLNNAALAQTDTSGRVGPPPIIGRWDIVVHAPGLDYPSWLEVRKSGRTTLVGQFVGRMGSVRPITQVEFHNGRVKWSVPIQWEPRKGDLVFEGLLRGDTLTGETVTDDGKKVTWTALRAADLKREKPPRWGEPIELFNGKDLAGWTFAPPGPDTFPPPKSKNTEGWIVRDGLLVNAKPGLNLVSERKFNDFKVHAEFRYPKDSNSGIYLRGRYEVQIEDDFGLEPDSHLIGGIYGFLNPSTNPSKPAGEWQTIDAELVGRVVTVHLNGERVIDRQAIPGITGGALDTDEGSPGPIMLQGDHGPIEFRKVTVVPGK
ncbi:MAG TPA: DUF1080 domain-containing protein [Gemmataceae bacterium]|nr:DUF1080 domain-containing protein [Gemmataceae bacterium]